MMGAFSKEEKSGVPAEIELVVNLLILRVLIEVKPFIPS